jgi:hypothetical protein
VKGEERKKKMMRRKIVTEGTPAIVEVDFGIYDFEVPSSS